MPNQRGIHVLGIESSCDDTGVALVNQNGQILSNCVHSQLKQHLLNGGIIPVVAKEFHMSNIDRIAKQAFAQSGLKSVAQDVDAIAVTTKPGLQFSLKVGLNYARTLAKKYSKPLIPIHHMQAHALMPLLQNRSIKFPFLALLISGGHCIISIAKRYNEFHILGQSLDEAPGDTLDKLARRFRLKNLGPPFDSISGGAAIELLAQRGSADKFKYFNYGGSVPMMAVKTCDLSFTGYRGSCDLLTPLIDRLWSTGSRQELLDELSHICASIQRVMLIQLVKKLHRAFMFYRMHWRYNNEDGFAAKGSGKTNEHLGFKLQEIDDIDCGLDVVVSGGVAANRYLVDGIRMALTECVEPNIRVFAPNRSLCSDNGLMIAWNGFLRYRDYLDGNFNTRDHHHPQRQDLSNTSSAAAGVVYRPEQMDSLEVEAQCPMGLDIRDQVRLANFNIKRLLHPEINVKVP